MTFNYCLEIFNPRCRGHARELGCPLEGMGALGLPGYLQQVTFKCLYTKRGPVDMWLKHKSISAGSTV